MSFIPDKPVVSYMDQLQWRNVRRLAGTRSGDLERSHADRWWTGTILDSNPPEEFRIRPVSDDPERVRLHIQRVKPRGDITWTGYDYGEFPDVDAAMAYAAKVIAAGPKPRS